MKDQLRPFDLGEMPRGRAMETIDERLVHADVARVFDVVKQVESWAAHLPHYRYVRLRERRPDGGGIVEMSAYRPFQLAGGPPATVFSWPTWWLSEMSVDARKPSIRFRHIGGITKGMDVEWTFSPVSGGTHVRILHVWNGPRWPVIGTWAATRVIGPVFVHGIASRTLAGLAAVAEGSRNESARKRG